MSGAPAAGTESRIRSLLKGLSWRMLASSATFAIVYLATGDASQAAEFTLYEAGLKLLLYYLHERAWLMLPPGSVRRLWRGRPGGSESHARSLLKGLSWRMLSILATLALGWTVLERRELAGRVAAGEFAAKVVLYYLHERLWLRLPRGAIRRRLSRRG